MFIAAIKAAYDDLVTRPFEYPDPGPDGERYRIEILPHDTPGYLDALASLEVDPMPFAERGKDSAARMAQALFAGQSANGKEDDSDRQEEKDRQEIIRAGFPHVQYLQCYTAAQGAAVAAAVCKHLVKSVTRIDKDGNEVLLKPAVVIKWFASASKLPRVMPGDVGRSLYMGGHPESAAVALAVLAEAVQEHKFKARIIPLSTASDSPEVRKATTGRKQASAQASPPP